MYKMLVVDDESLTREYMKLTIPQIHDQWEVAYVAMDGKEALEILEEHAVDLIITDIKMPEMDGLTLCRIVSQTIPRPRTVILSGHDEFMLAKEAISYGVNEYLLKPIVKDELRAVLDRMTLEMNKEKNQELAERTMAILSEDSKNHVVKTFLKAVIIDSNAEIKVLYPLVFRLKVSLIESEGMALILSLDEDVFIDKSIPVRDIPVFKYILHQVTTEIVEKEQLARVFYDSEENTIVLVTGDSETEMIQKSKDIHAKVAEAIYMSIAITITGAIGTSVNDVLRLNSSYRKAHKFLLSRLHYGGNAFYSYSSDTDALQAISELDKTMSAIISGLLDNNDMTYTIAVKHYVGLFSSYTQSAVFRYGFYMIRSIAALIPSFPDEGIQSALNILKKLESTQPKESFNGYSKEFTIEEVLFVFYEIIKSFAVYTMPSNGHENEHDLVAKAKEFIYTHYAEPISLALIAETVGVTASYLSNIFHKSVNESYIKFLTRVRMEQAAKLLKARPAEKILDVAEKVGYVSVKHFSHVFKQHFHMPPGEYQEKHMIPK